MKGTLSIGAIQLILACAISAALMKPVQDRLDDRVGKSTKVLDLLYFGSSTAVKTLALGYDGLLADVYWMRAIQYYGRREEAQRRPVLYGNLAALLDITTTLDPHLLNAYRFGGVFLGEPEPMGAGQPQEAIRIIDRGIRAFPLEWHLRFDKGFIYFWYVSDYRKAGDVWLEASRVPGAPKWLEGLAAMGLSKSGAVETARMLWQRQYDEAERAEVKENARKYLLTMQIDEDCWTLEFFVEKFRKRFGRRPAMLQDLVSSGLLKDVARDPSRVPYRYDPASGRVRISPETKLGYLKKMPYDYRDPFLKKLEERYGPD